MTKTKIYVYLAASLTMVVPLPGRFSYGIILIVFLNCLMLSGVLFRRLITTFALESLLSFLIALVLVSECVLFKELLILYSPLMALTLGLGIYMPAVSSFLIGALYKDGSTSLRQDVRYSLHEGLSFSIFALCMFLFRDIFGYGTISLPSRHGLVQLRVLPTGEGHVHAGTFWASIPGAIILCLLSILLLAYVNRNICFAEERAAHREDSQHA